MPFQEWMGAPVAVKRAAILLHLVLFLVAFAADERRAGIVGRQRRQDVLLQEKATLLAFKRGLTLLKPSALADWNESNGNVCNFTGVTCDWRREHVVVLALGDMNIHGAIPPVVGNLSHLRTLNMSFNYISGAIPPSVGNLSHLEYLDMSYNLLTGHIPAELSNLRSIEALSLGQNQLRGGIPPPLAELTSMYYLNLENNNLSGPIPVAIFKNCTRLVVVELGDNHLSGLIPQDASSTFAGTFAVLSLYSNRLTGTIPRWLANCTCLMILDVENNLLTDELPTGIISGKRYLKYLHLSNNRFWSQDGNTNLEPFFAAISSCRMILEIEAGAVEMGGRLPSRLGSMLPPTMSILNLELNKILGPIPDDIGDVINITLMNLSSNLLNGTIPASLCQLSKLQRLVLSKNALTGEIPPCIGNAKSLGELDLSDNALSGIIPSGIGNLTQLCKLDLSSNGLSGQIPASLARCMALLSLNLSSNGLSGEIPASLARFTALLSLHLWSNSGDSPCGI